MRRYIATFGFTQKQIAKELGMTQYTLSYKLRFLKGYQLKFCEIIAICDLIGCSYCEFFEKYYSTLNERV